ncbi:MULTISPECIES: transporter substrate-binding domain-containing protein [Halomonadaceae]|jgi:arginine/ornithine transport system substrate-binding protein|uniref:Transporter substrate-binding domain-containing protein n=1 Tax=Vreelandella janggokensis TaxID=370767 RepID=A0ABT4IS62_9GAMM|nr:MULTISPECIES: transporter substrate-binding domain-containing protein [Halomonas]MCW4153273.1 transporter substrate-binding domain-containing protein [Halomonas sp. 18H]MCZ0925837.1 transporter substrate-binding domain-containing protein [Halomonas janggokensis]MCZ0930904.1 transporter substrate-binding domain-containing protein [Halomonas janggokensis]MDR5886285.1 transporter substrate-binding domain-containing protein [Halomonas janggokensis]QPL47135.1 transporter substrate-binding domain
MKKVLTLSLLGLAMAASSAQAQDYEEVRIGVDVPYEPMEYRTPDGDLTGFDIDLGNALCEEIGVSCEWVVQGWDGIIPGLLSRKYDAIMSSMTINDDRREQVLFSDPYITPPSAWFAPAGVEFDAVNEETLTGMTIGVQRGTLQDNYVTDMYGDVADINRYATADDMVLDMESERLDILFLDFPVGKSTLLESEEGDYIVVGDMLTEPKEYFGDGFGIAFRQRDEALAEQFNEALETLRDNGTYDEIYARYFDAE